jgi:Spy/CpxP family protein refolding chaperone
MTRLLFFVLGSLVTLAVGFGWHHQRGRFGHGWSPEHARDAVGWWLRGVDATDAQVDAIAAIVDEAIGELEALRERHRDRLEEAGEVLAAPEIDRAALEKLRAESVALADQASARIVDALAAASARLTPAQRAELLERHERLHRRWHGER